MLLQFLLSLFIVCTTLAGRHPVVVSVDNSGISNSSGEQQILQEFRLPKNIRPETYNISIRTWIHAANFTFTGFVRIGIVAVETTNYITLHQNVQSIQNLRILSVDNVAISIGNLTYNSEFELLTIPVTGVNLTEGEQYFIEIDYVGVVGNYYGFFRYRHYEEDVEHWYASTLFEPTYARRAFPCFDEPSLKSNFTIRITHDPSYSAISNMPAISETPEQK